MRAKKTMAELTCGFADQLLAFAEWRKASGRWNRHDDATTRYFDAHCAGVDPEAASLTQHMIDSWCERRDTESGASCNARTNLARRFCDWARGRGLTDAVTPARPKVSPSGYVPHSFTDRELTRLFAAADSIVPARGRLDSKIRKVQCVAFFRLLYSSGLRTVEARLLRREDVDLERGLLSIRRSKGPDQRYVALHPSMTEVLRAYDEAAERLQPGREWFFESRLGGHLSEDWVSGNFEMLWREANGEPDGAIAYQLRHEYARRNVTSWDCDAYDAHDRLLALSASMGHRSVESTLHYFSLAPAISDKILERTGEEMESVIPDLWEVAADEGEEGEDGQG